MKLKILSTIGPATEKKENIKTLMKYSDILRTNGSHNSLKWHEKISLKIKSINSKKIHLFDIPGVKPRTKNTNKIYIKFNEKVCFYFKKNLRNKIKQIELSKPLPLLKRKIKYFSVSDGQFLFEVISFKKNYVIGKSKSNFVLYPKEGLNIPGAIYDDNLQLALYE